VNTGNMILRGSVT